MDRLLEVPPEELNSEDTDGMNITSETWKSSSKVTLICVDLYKPIKHHYCIKSRVARYQQPCFNQQKPMY